MEEKSELDKLVDRLKPLVTNFIVLTNDGGHFGIYNQVGDTDEALEDFATILQCMENSMISGIVLNRIEEEDPERANRIELIQEVNFPQRLAKPSEIMGKRNE